VIQPSDKNLDMAGTQAAMIRATRRALHEARIHGELVPVWREGNVVWVHPDEIELDLPGNDDLSMNRGEGAEGLAPERR
jgi:hypothetical protein